MRGNFHPCSAGYVRLRVLVMELLVSPVIEHGSQHNLEEPGWSELPPVAEEADNLDDSCVVKPER
jgi:hypothetical protein